jgi:hypothetical protein
MDPYGLICAVARSHALQVSLSPCLAAWQPLATQRSWATRSGWGWQQQEPTWRGKLARLTSPTPPIAPPGSSQMCSSAAWWQRAYWRASLPLQCYEIGTTVVHASSYACLYILNPPARALLINAAIRPWKGLPRGFSNNTPAQQASKAMSTAVGSALHATHRLLPPPACHARQAVDLCGRRARQTEGRKKEQTSRLLSTHQS